jgi:hypothetical protein
MDMKKYILIFFCATLIWSCKDDDNSTLEPSYADVDWFEIKDGPDEIDHLRYGIYTSTGISILYSDILGTQFRGLNGFGDSIIYTQRLNPYYAIVGTSGNIAYTFSENKTDIRNGVLFLKEQVIPLLNPVIYPRSFFLVESLILNASSTIAAGNREGSVFRGLMTTLVSHVSEMGSLNATEKHALGAEISAPIWAAYLEMEYAVELVGFYLVSDNSVTNWPTNASNRTTYNRDVRSNPGTYDIPTKPHWNEFGFLIKNPDLISNTNIPTLLYYTPTQTQDLTSFVQAALTYSEVEFQALYENVTGYNLLINKYRMVKKLIDAVNDKY